MPEGEKREERVPIRVFQQEKPEDGEGYTWKRETHVDKPDQTVSWVRVSTTGHKDPEGFTVPEEARKKKKKKVGQFDNLITSDEQEKKRIESNYSGGIEKSQPRGDKDED